MMSNFERQENFNLFVVIPTHNRWRTAEHALTCLLRSNYRNFTVLLIDDGCSDGTVEKCRELFPEVEILHGDGNLWWAGAVNLGIKRALADGADAIILLNDDNNVEEGTIGSLVESFQRFGSRSVVCSRIRVEGDECGEWRGDPPGWHPDSRTWRPQDFGDQPVLQIRHPPGGQGVLIPADCFREIGLFDDRNLPFHWADHNFHYRAMKQGYSYFIARDAMIWNVPNEIPAEAVKVSTLRGAWWFLSNRRSPANLVELQKHLRLSLRPREYRQVFYPILFRRMLWLSYEGLRARPTIHLPFRVLKRAFWKRPSAASPS